MSRERLRTDLSREFSHRCKGDATMAKKYTLNAADIELLQAEFRGERGSKMAQERSTALSKVRVIMKALRTMMEKKSDDAEGITESLMEKIAEYEGVTL